MSPEQTLIVLAIGAAAGLIGGLSGVGGSVVMLPMLGLVIGYNTPEAREHHVYQAAAMAVNAVIAGSSVRQHLRAGAVRRDLVVGLLPSMGVCVGLGVLASYAVGGQAAKAALAAFLLVFCVYNTWTTVRKLPERRPEDERRHPAIGIGVGGLAGALAGFLGIGGGIVLVPGMALIKRTPLRQAIAASATVMAPVAFVGAILKFSMLGRAGLSWTEALGIAVPMGIGAVAAAPVGAWLTHKLELPFLKLAVSAVLAASGAKLVGWI